MDDVKDMVSKGYKSLASRTICAYNDVCMHYNLHNVPALKRLFGMLDYICDNGDIRHLGEEGRKVFSDSIITLDLAIPERLKPFDEGSARKFAVDAMENYMHIYGIENLKSEGNITDIVMNSGQRILKWSLSEEGVVKELHLVYDPNLPAYSTIGNIHEFYHAFQTEKEAIYRLLKEMSEVPGFKRLTSLAYNDPHLKEELSRITKESHQLNYYKLPAVLELAANEGIDTAPLSGFIEKNTPLMNFLMCYKEGDAYLKQTEILSGSSFAKDDPRVLKLYRLMSLCDALAAALQPLRPTIFEAGIGMAESMRMNRTSMKDCGEFHDKLTKEYFPG
ncbi:hypothetical protein KY366_03460 [Candidatus Woesearchaeota archaeon]|nr:hypothetical protein [Candidatus Woesearchaeota archaeon]